MVAERRADREEHVARGGAACSKRELEKVDIPAEISGRAKHFYSIYDKMAKKGREFNEIYDLTAMRVIVERDGEEGTRDCYGALGLIHSLWKPMPGRFKDYIAMPKFNGYRSLHTTVIGPEGRPLEIQVRTREMHETAELGIAAHWCYKRRQAAADEEWVAWVKQLMDSRPTSPTRASSCKSFRTDLFDDEVFVFTPKGEVKTLPAGATPIDFAYAVHTDVGHRTVGAKVNGRIVPLHYKLQSGDFVEMLTSKSRPRPVARLARRSRRRRAHATRSGSSSRVSRRRTPRQRAARRSRTRSRPEPPVPQARRLGGARAGDPRVGLQEGRGLLHRARLRQADRRRSSTRCSAAEDRARSPRRRRSRARPKAREAPSRARHVGITSRASRTCSSASRSAARRCRATRSSATSRSARA